MILRPVRPQSPCGPPITKRPVGIDQVVDLLALISSFGSTGLMISSITASSSCSCSMSGWCWVESTTVSIRRLAVDVAHGDLRLRVRTQPRQLARRLRSSAWRSTSRCDRIDRQRHQLRRLVAGVAEHQALVAGALVEVEAAAFVHALRDVRRLLVVGDQHGAALVVDAVVGVVVADALDRLARDRLIVDHGVRGDLAGQHHQAGGAQRFRGDARVFVLR